MAPAWDTENIAGIPGNRARSGSRKYFPICLKTVSGPETESWIFYRLRGDPCRHVSALTPELRLTVPELMYLFFFSFFLAFITWYEGGAGNIMTTLTCSTILCIDPWASNKNIFLCLLHDCGGNGASGMSPINAIGENKTTLITPYSKHPWEGGGGAYEHLQPDKRFYTLGRVDHACLRKDDED